MAVREDGEKWADLGIYFESRAKKVCHHMRHGVNNKC